MEGKRFGIGLAAGVLLALAVVTVSGGLGTASLTGTFGSFAAATSSSTTTAFATTSTATSTAASTISSTTVPATVTYTVSMTSTTSSGSGESLNSNATSPVTSSTTTVTSTIRSSPSTTSNPGSQTAGTSANGGSPYYYLTTPSGNNRPTQLTSIAQQPIASNAEILAPILVAFLLGAFLYRVAVQERERSSGD